MRNMGRSLTIAGLTALYTYLVMLGGTYNLLTPSIRWVSFIAAAGLGLLWLLARWRGRWPWPQTALDAPMLLWLGAIGLSLLLNLASWRRELIGIWFVLLYIGTWFLLSDLLARGVVRRAQLMNVITLGALPVVVIGFVQSRVWLTDQLPQMLTRAVPFALPRPGSTLGNPNTLAAVLVVLAPLAAAWALRSRGVARWMAWGITGAATLLMGLTYSRGGWVGLLAAFALLGGLLLVDQGLIHPDAFRRWWNRQSRSVRAGMMTTLLAGTLLVLVVVISLLVSLGQAGRTLDLRTFLYNAAIHLFADQPIAGHGLFTFGRGLAAQFSTPPWQSHSHAHNMVLHVAAELGIAGLIALLATLLAVLHTLRANWQAASRSERVLLAGAYAALAGFVIHHQLDFPAMVPVVALTGLIVLVAACAPVAPLAALNPLRGRVSAGLASGLWVGLIVSGLWSLLIYSDYTDALYRGVNERDYRAAAEQMQSAIDRDPALAVQLYQQGFLYGMAAADGDMAALPLAVGDFQRYVALEPYYATGWVNLGALQMQAGDVRAAVESLRRAVAAAPEYGPYQYLLARAEERAGNTDLARAFYRQALQASPDLILEPGWSGSPLRDDLAAVAQPSELAQVALRLHAGQVGAARVLWDSVEAVPPGYDATAIAIWLLLREGRVDEAAAARAALTDWEGARDGRAWLAFLDAEQAAANGDPAHAAESRAAALAALERAPFENDDIDLPNIHYIQYLHTALPRTYLPQVDFPVSSPILQHLLAE